MNTRLLYRILGVATVVALVTACGGPTDPGLPDPDSDRDNPSEGPDDKTGLVAPPGDVFFHPGGLA